MAIPFPPFPFLLLPSLSSFVLACLFAVPPLHIFPSPSSCLMSFLSFLSSPPFLSSYTLLTPFLLLSFPPSSDTHMILLLNGLGRSPHLLSYIYICFFLTSTYCIYLPTSLSLYHLPIPTYLPTYLHTPTATYIYSHLGLFLDFLICRFLSTIYLVYLHTYINTYIHSNKHLFSS